MKRDSSEVCRSMKGSWKVKLLSSFYDQQFLSSLLQKKLIYSVDIKVNLHDDHTA